MRYRFGYECPGDSRNLEYLEAEFYSVAVSGSVLSSSVTGATSAATGGAKVTFTDSRVADIAAEISADETLHVKYLRTALSASAVAEPVINLNSLGIGFATQAQFLTLARAFEDAGVSAYAGAATLLTGNNLQAAAQFLAVEAYHAGNIRLYVVEDSITVPATDSQDVPPTEQHFFPTDSNGLPSSSRHRRFWRSFTRTRRSARKVAVFTPTE